MTNIDIPWWQAQTEGEEDLVDKVDKRHSATFTDTEEEVSPYSNDMERLKTESPVPRNWMAFKEALFELMKHHIRGIEFMSTNLYDIQHNGIKTVPAITYSLIRSRPLRSPKRRLRYVENASPNVTGAERRVWEKAIQYTVQFNIWGETEEDAEMATQKLHDFFDNNGDSLQRMGVYHTWIGDLTDIEIKHMLLKYSVRSAQYSFDIAHLSAEYIDEVQGIHVNVIDTQVQNDD
jgi:hypothetical protein